MKKLLIILYLFLTRWQLALAEHIAGGEIYYRMISSQNGIYRYAITLKQFRRCSEYPTFYNPTALSIFKKGTGERVSDLKIALTGTDTISIANLDPCISNPPTVCYELGFFEFELELPGSIDGYLIASQVNFRIQGENYQTSMGKRIGALYVAEIPGTDVGINAPNNASARFTGSDLVVVCANQAFTYSFGASDADGDGLRYGFCGAYQSQLDLLTFSPSYPPKGPPFTEIPYTGIFSGTAPMGPMVKIDSITGMITGTAPGAGHYVVSVCVKEIRNGQVIATQRKDIEINVTPCSNTTAELETEYLICSQDKRLQAENKSLSTLINTYDWSILNLAQEVLYESKGPKLDYVFADTGIYLLQLIINRQNPCSDTAQTLVKVYPGPVADFGFNGLCTGSPTSFLDYSSSQFGNVESWLWTFGQSTSISNLPNPNYTFMNDGQQSVKLVVADSKGCTDSVTKQITIGGVSLVPFTFRDTLICLGDEVTLESNLNGDVLWSPAIGLVSTVGSSVVASPNLTTTFFAEYVQEGCRFYDSLIVRVVDEVGLSATTDTIICQGDLLQLHATSNGTKTIWEPAALFNNPSLTNQVLRIDQDLQLQVTASIGGCSETKSILVKAAPYATANAGNDTIVCAGVQPFTLNGVTSGTRTNWSPTSEILSQSGTTALVAPKQTTTFVFTAYYDKGCPKPALDSVQVIVLPLLHPFAGRDTSVMVGQVLQLHGSGGTGFQWSPARYFSDRNIANPTVVFSEPTESIRFKLVVSDMAGCTDSAYINIIVFAPGPSVYVPTGFTPNSDGLNDQLKPVLAGPVQLISFSIYNRFGERIFSTKAFGVGWDGNWKGQMQPAGAYIWHLQAIDAAGKKMNTTGTAMLVR